MIQSAIQLKDQQHKQEIEELREEINQQHRQQMDALTVALTEQFTRWMAAQLADQATLYEEQFRSLEGYRVGISELEVTTERASQDVRLDHQQIEYKVTINCLLISINKII
jgi:hypothetical protein